MVANNLYLNIDPFDTFSGPSKSTTSHDGPSGQSTTSFVLNKVKKAPSGSFAVRRVPSASITARSGINGLQFSSKNPSAAVPAAGSRLAAQTTTETAQFFRLSKKSAAAQKQSPSTQKQLTSNQTQSTTSKKPSVKSVTFSKKLQSHAFIPNQKYVPQEKNLTLKTVSKSSQSAKVTNVLSEKSNKLPTQAPVSDASRIFSTKLSDTGNESASLVPETRADASAATSVSKSPSSFKFTAVQEKNKGPNNKTGRSSGSHGHALPSGGGQSAPGTAAGGDSGAGPTASLFTGNPDIPQLPESTVKPLLEEVFSEDSFAELNLSPVLASHVAKLGFSSITRVQQRGIPPILAGKDVLIKSQTGSGKTLTYALPIVNALMTMTPRVTRDSGVLALMVVPTRELTLQTYNWIRDLCKACVNIVPGYLMGGEKKKSEKNRLRRGVNILVATPGRLLDHIDTTECLALRNVRYLVLDEADRMLEMGYEKSIASIMEAVKGAKMMGDAMRFEGKRSMEEEHAARKRKLAGDDRDEGNVSKKFKSDQESGSPNNDSGNDDDSSDDEECANEDIDDESELTSSTSTKVMSLPPTKTKAPSAAPASRHQTVMLSATLSSQVQKLAGLNLQSPEIITVGDSFSSPDELLSCSAVVTPENLKHYFVFVPPKFRLVTLAAFVLSKCLYGSLRKMIVFMATQDMVDYHTTLLRHMLGRYGSVQETKPAQQTEEQTEADDVLAAFNSIKTNKRKEKKLLEQKQDGEDEDKEPLIHFMQLRGNMAQSDRTKVFNQFRAAPSGVLICTDVAARGLDLPLVAWIVQYTPAGSISDYVHRVGRTSRANTPGNALVMLAPSEAGYLQEMERSKISIKEIEMMKVLTATTLRPPKMNPAFTLPRSAEEGATKLQQSCEELLLSSPDHLALAKKGYISFVRAYASYPASMKNIFHVKDLHLGHYAKSFALREAPSVLGAGIAFKAQTLHREKKEKNERREKIRFTGVMAQRSGAVPKMATVSEFDCGLEGLPKLLTARKQQNNKHHNHVRSKNRGERPYTDKKQKMAAKSSKPGKSAKSGGKKIKFGDKKVLGSKVRKNKTPSSRT